MDRQWEGMGKWMAIAQRLCRSIALVVLLAGCTAPGVTPLMSWNTNIVKQAIALQLHLVQDQFNSSLQIADSPRWEIKRIKVTQSVLCPVGKPLLDDSCPVRGTLPTFHIQGTYAVDIKLSRRKIQQQHSAFEVYLQRQIEGETWRLLHPQVTAAGTTEWLSYQL